MYGVNVWIEWIFYIYICILFEWMYVVDLMEGERNGIKRKWRNFVKVCESRSLIE